MGYTKSLDSESIGDDQKVRRRHVEVEDRNLNPQTWGEMLKAWPKTTLCIVSNEFCERFSYYGMRTVLTLYLLNVLKFSDNISTVFFNGFTVLCYLTPMLGSVMADGYVGKFWTIFSVSILYAAGNIILAIASVENGASSVHPYMDLAGLIIIGFGTGGIKPCVVSFGGDQFLPEQERMRSMFFSMFYFSINAGSMISTFVSPIFRSQPCLGQDSCYPLAFGLPAILMIIATIAFMAGSPWYKKPPPKENVFAEVFKVVRGKYMKGHTCQGEEKCLALQKKKRNKSLCAKRQFVADTKALGKVLIMFLPVPFFWSLYDQQGSIWLIQGVQMNCKLWGNALLLPDQMQTLNAVLILAFIPLFQVIIYPVAAKCVKLTPLRKMVVGGILAAASFAIAAFVQFAVNKTLPQLPEKSHSYVSVMNSFNQCNLTVIHQSGKAMFVGANSSLENDKLNNVFNTFDIPKDQNSFMIYYNSSNSNDDCRNVTNWQEPINVTYSFSGGDVHYIYVGMNGVFTSKVDTDKPTEGTGEFKLSVALTMQDLQYVGNMAICRKDTEGTNSEHPCDPQRPQDFYYYEIDYDDDKDSDLGSLTAYNTRSGVDNARYATIYTFKSIRPGSWGIYFMNETAKSVGKRTLSKDAIHVSNKLVEFTKIEQGGVYVMSIHGSNSSGYGYTLFKAVQDNSVSILWQVPQYVVITAAEILFSITGYEFAYSQAPQSMKALLQAFWLLTTAVGDSIIVGIAAANIFSNMAIQFLAYAGVMLVVIAIFAVMSYFYTYQYYLESEEDKNIGTDDFDEESIQDELISPTRKPYLNNGYKKDDGDAESWDYRM